MLWYGYYTILPKIHRHSLGQRIDNLFIEIIEFIAIASFLSKEEKLPYIKVAIRKADTLKILLMILWETKSLDNKKYIAISVKMDEIGKMLGGWSGQILKTFNKFRINKTPLQRQERNEEICETAKVKPLLRFHLLSGLS